MKKSKVVPKRVPDLINLSKLSEVELRSLAKIADSREGKVLLKIIETYVYNRMSDVYKRRTGDPTDWTINAAFDQGRGAGVTHLKLALLGAVDELERREKGNVAAS